MRELYGFSAVKDNVYARKRLADTRGRILSQNSKHRPLTDAQRTQIIREALRGK